MGAGLALGALSGRELTYRVAGTPIPSERSVSAPPFQHCTARVVAAALDADTKEELGQQRDLGLQWRLERGRERGELSSAFAKRRAAHWMPSRRRGLRSVFATFFGKAKISRSQCLSSGATRDRGPDRTELDRARQTDSQGSIRHLSCRLLSNFTSTFRKRHCTT